MELREANGLSGAVFTADAYAEVRQWVQDRSAQREIVAQAAPLRLYLPVGLSGMVVVDEGDTIWWDAEGGENAFSLERA